MGIKLYLNIFNIETEMYFFQDFFILIGNNGRPKNSHS